jgi:hypothetical protein
MRQPELNLLKHNSGHETETTCRKQKVVKLKALIT